MRKYLLLLTSGLLPTSLAAQESSSNPTDDELLEIEEQLVNPASRVPQNDVDFPIKPVGVDPFPITVTANGVGTSIRNTGQAVTVIDLEEIESVQGADIVRVLNRVPGTSFSRNGSIGGFTGVNIRGAGAEQLLVLIDGVRVADPASPGGGYDFGNLLSANIGKIDLLRGSNSTIWGSDAVGGVLDISTRGETGLTSSLEYGARDTVTASIAGGLDADGFYAGLNASAFQTDGFSSAASGTERDGFEQLTLGGSAFVDLTDTLELFVNGRYAEGDLEIDGFPAPAFALADTLETQETEQFSGAAGLAFYGQDLTLRASFSLADTERTNLDPVFGPTFTSDGESERLSLRGEYRLIGGLSLAFGGEHEWSRYETLFDTGASTEITGVYGQLGWVLGDLAVHAGLRADDHQRFGSATSFGGDISYGFGDGWRARASVGEGFKAPTLFQLFSDFGNETLSPERSTSFDIGIEKGTRGRGLYVAATAYRRDSEDLIDFVSCFGSTDPICTGRPFGTYDNVDRARAQGIELEAGADLAEGLRLSGVYSLVDAEDRVTGNELARRPRHLATVFADYRTPFGLRLSADFRIVSRSFDNAANTVRLDGYEVLDFRAAFPVTEGLELFGRVENVFDTDYQTAAGYAQAGRGAFVGVRASM